MASRKEDEKNEKIIRGLTKLPENRRCINCGSLGPQYICTNFAIFICTTCGGLHREFTHRVKSISMATFTPAEVAALQAGGNQRARDVYFREWDSTRHALPDSSNPDKLRDFIKAVYVDRRFSGGEKQKGRLSDSEDVNDRRTKFGQSPSFEDRYEDRRYGNRPGSRGSDRGFDEKMSPARFERYDDRRRPDDRERRYEDRGRAYEDRDFRRPDERDRERRFDYEEREAKAPVRRTSDDWDSRRAGRPPGYKGGETPPVRSVRDILGDDVPKLRVEDHIRMNGRAEDNESPRSISSQGEGKLRTVKSMDESTNGGMASNAVPQTVSESLIDFGGDTEPSPPAQPAQGSTAAPFDPFNTSQQPKAVNTTSFDPFAASDVSKPGTMFEAFSSSADPPKPAAASFDPFSASEQPATSGWASFDSPPVKAPAQAAPSAASAGSFFNQPSSQPQVPAKPNGVQGSWPPQQASVMHNWTAGGVQAQSPVSFQEQWRTSAPPTFQQPPHPSFQQPPQQAFQQPPQQSFQQPPQPSFQQPLQPSFQQPPQTSFQQPPQPSFQQPPQPSFQQPPQSSFQQQPLQPSFQQPAVTNQLPMDNGNQTKSSRPEIPENLFALAAAGPYNHGGMHVHMPSASFGMPQPGVFPAGIPGGFASYAQMPPSLQPSSAKSNPFDVPGGDTPADASFPNMNPLQKALPTFNAVLPLGEMMHPPSQWSQQAPAPPSYAPLQPPLAGGAAFNHQQPPQFLQGHFARPNAGYLGMSAAPQPPPLQPAAGGSGNPFM